MFNYIKIVQNTGIAKYYNIKKLFYWLIPDFFFPSILLFIIDYQWPIRFILKQHEGAVLECRNFTLATMLQY